jgi:hypothetical protein
MKRKIIKANLGAAIQGANLGTFNWDYFNK